ncbi:ASCH domain-containing protein [Palleronia abyssalis]|uniref:ASCH domain-containing protein n=1 Tax=Palleronia abyssalis TaxID=1501240 RepID=A0A2R8BRX1_9RHOB|nr:ASCH domain-containing protein [Palleronia abyssalis]SPJ22909.1 hypothetical protein PAA8504_00708 [Palleronia abyssalis]
MSAEASDDRVAGFTTFRFGDGPELCDRLLGLVIAGQKTATCGALREFEADPESRPAIGRRDIACRWDWTPAVMIETVDVFECAFRDVPEDFALAEGEGTFAEWRDGHVDYFTRNGGWSEDMLLLCERFRVIEVLE